MHLRRPALAAGAVAKVRLHGIATLRQSATRCCCIVVTLVAVNNYSATPKPCCKTFWLIACLISSQQRAIFMQYSTDVALSVAKELSFPPVLTASLARRYNKMKLEKERKKKRFACVTQVAVSPAGN